MANDYHNGSVHNLKIYDI